MFAFAFVRGLLKFNADGPEFEVLFQFAPTIGKRYMTYSHRPENPAVILAGFLYDFSFCDFIQPPRSLPISHKRSEISK